MAAAAGTIEFATGTTLALGALQWLPCRIEYDGPADLDTHFIVQQSPGTTLGLYPADLLVPVLAPERIACHHSKGPRP